MPHCGCEKRKCHCECYNHEIMPTPTPIDEYLNKCEKILFTGNYNKTTLKLYPEISKRMESVEINFPTLGAKGFSYIQFSCMSDAAGQNKFVDLVFDIALYNNNLSTGEKIGQISIINIQRDNQAECDLLRSGPVVKVFDINSQSGYFKNVTRVILDLRQPERVFYFIGKY